MPAFDIRGISVDYILDIMLPKSEIGKINLSEQLVEWGGETFSQDPPRYTNRSNLFFTEYDTAYYERLLGGQYPISQLTALHLEGSLLDLELTINNKGDFLNNEVMLFLFELLKLETFIILLIRDEEWLDEQYIISGREELQTIICDSLSWSNPKGAVIVSPGFKAKEGREEA